MFANMKLRSKMFLLFSSVFLILLLLLILAVYLFMDDFYIQSNRKNMINFANQFDERVQMEGPDIKGEGGYQQFIVNDQFEPQGPSDALDPQTIDFLSPYISKRDAIFLSQENQLVVVSPLLSGDFLILIKPMGLADEVKGLINRYILGAAGLIYIIGMAGFALLSAIITKPIVMINKKTKAIADLDFTDPLVIDRGDELGQLAESINQMSNRLSDAYDSLEKSLAEERQLDRMRRRFVADVSHELKNPLTMIQGYAEGLIRGVVKTREQEGKYHQIIFDESKRINAIIQDMLDLSAYEAGMMQLNMGLVDLARLTDKVITSFEPVCQAQKLSFTFELEPITLQGDAIRLEQALVNLVGNAVKHGESYINVKLYKDQAVHLAIVNDVSSDMTASLEDLFNPFYRQSDAKGVGLGLSIAKGIIDMHRGQIKVSRHKNQIKFEIILPANDIKNERMG